MWPLLKDGDEILVSNDSCVLKKGDIITVCNRYGRILTHRIIDEVTLVTKGDNNVYPEKALLKTSFELLGKVDYVIKKGRKININKYNTIFLKYSSFEMKTYAYIKKHIPFNSLIYSIKKIMYPIFIFTLKIYYGRDYQI
ncbi:hypothetical protein PHEL85_3409 [Polaribacter sp. Hel1_85]|nr:hypothetical protein PHEL85_3409 [Polaribacter sp. Hel1_85]